MKMIERHLFGRLGQCVQRGFDIRHAHIHRNRFKRLAAPTPQGVKVTLQALGAASVLHRQYTLRRRDDRHVIASLGKGDLINTDIGVAGDAAPA